LAFTVRVTGPEFASEESQRAFLRIEESARQYSAHSREPVYLIRRPLEIPEDHFVLLWPRGAAIAGMYPYGGIIRGWEHGNWESERSPSAPEPRRLSMRPRPEHPVTTFANPHSTLEAARRELAGILTGDSLEREPAEMEVAQSSRKETISPENTRTLPPAREEAPFGLIALFTGPVEQMRIAPFSDTLFFAMTFEDAVARSIVHTPNLLRAAEIPGVSYSNDALEKMYGLLERSAQIHGSIRESERETEMPLPPVAPLPAVRQFKFPLQWLAPIGILLAAIVFFAVRSIRHPGPLPTPPMPPGPVSHPPSEIVIKMPVEAELFISSYQFHTRQLLDRALTYGEGERFLPDTEDIVVRDSLSLAKGVYGYFNVENTWRKGMLLQTLQHVDTISIVRFLDPLP